MARTKDSAKDLRAALNEILLLVESVAPRYSDSLTPALTDHETPEYILGRVRTLVHRYREAKALQDQTVALFRAFDRLS